MTTLSTWQASLTDLGRAAVDWIGGWWQILHDGALILVLALSPSSYVGANRAAIARHLVLGTAPVLLWFVVLSSLLSLVIIRIVIATALSYGLSQYAVEMLVRVLVLELIPLTAAIFAALYSALPAAADVAARRARRAFDELAREGVDPLQREVLPRVLGTLFAVLMLATVACVVAAVLAYLSIYGFTSSAFAGYTRVFGHVFGPAVSTIFALKSALFGLAVAVIPVAAALHDAPARGLRTSAELRSLVRLFAVILLIEAASLVGNYY
jgi:phospholipid/cholesterol/gamma-HCH transport system permease protein